MPLPTSTPMGPDRTTKHTTPPNSINNINKLFVVDHTFTPLGAATTTATTSSSTTTTTKPSPVTPPTTTITTTTTNGTTNNGINGNNNSATPTPPATNGTNSRPSLSLGPLPANLDIDALSATMAAQAQFLNNHSNPSSNGSPSTTIPQQHPPHIIAPAFCPTCGQTISDAAAIMMLPLYTGYGLLNPVAYLNSNGVVVVDGEGVIDSTHIPL